MKLLYFQTDTDDSTAFNSANLSMIDQNGDGTVILTFVGAGVTDGSSKTGRVTLNVTSGKEDVVIKAIANAAANNRQAFVTIADDANSAYCHGDITTCGAIEITQ